MSDIAERGPVYSLLDAKVLVPSGSSLTATDLFYVRTIAVDPQITTLTFEGDDTSQQIDKITRVDVTVTCDKHDDDAIQAIFNKTKVTGIAGESWGMYMGDQTEEAGVTVGLQYDLAAIDESGSPSASYTLRYTWPRGRVKVIRPQQAEWQAKHTLVLNFSFERTTTDATGTAIDGVSAPGIYYRRARLS